MSINILPVSVVIPIYKEELTTYEIISLQQCYSILWNYPIVFVCPKNMESGKFYQSQKSKGQFVFLDNANFESIITYNHMLLSVWFYELFKAYKYILIYQLDCFVFKDDLMLWVDKGYSYIGAPWFKWNSANGNSDELIGVGNGGFSLRRVQDCIILLKSSKKINSIKILLDRKRESNKMHFWAASLKRYWRSYSFNTVKNDFSINEDKIFSLASMRFQNFKIPLPSEALSFAFEKQPNKLYKINGNQLPFGCHAWERNELNFYKPIFKKYGYKIK